MEILHLLFKKHTLIEEKRFGKSHVLKIDQPSLAFYIELLYQRYQDNNIHGM